MASVSFDPDTGVQLPTTAQVRDDVARAFQEAFRVNPEDPPLRTDPTTPEGQMIDIVASEVEAKNAEVAFLSNQFNPGTSKGVFLDGVAALYGLERKLSEPTVVTCICRGLKGTVIPYGAIVQDTQGNNFRHSAVAEIGDDGTVSTPFSAVKHGGIEVAPESVSRIITVVAGWDSVINPAAGSIGRDREPDAELRNRILNSYAINANGTVANLLANLQEVDGVLDVAVLENYSNAPETQYGITVEGHSVAICIVGGKDEDIAEVIYQRKPGGCGTTGDYEVSHIDTEHFNAKYTYKITRPTTENFRIRVEFFSPGMPEDTQKKVKEALMKDFLGELSSQRVKLASTVYASRFYRAVQDITSDAVKQILIALGDDPYGVGVEIPARIEPSIAEETIELVFEE